MVVLVVIEFGAFGVLATAIHGRLALDRPDERHLTTFYLVLSAGGVLATGLVALAAPLIFSTVLEYPLLVVAATVVLAMLARPESSDDSPGARGVLLGIGRRLVPYAAIAGSCTPWSPWAARAPWWWRSGACSASARSSSPARGPSAPSRC